jgi:hypothetical protein
MESKHDDKVRFEIKWRMLPFRGVELAASLFPHATTGKPFSNDV